MSGLYSCNELITVTSCEKDHSVNDEFSSQWVSNAKKFNAIKASMRELFISIFHFHPFQLEGVSLIHWNHLASVAVVKWIIIVGMRFLDNMLGAYNSILYTTVKFATRTYSKYQVRYIVIYNLKQY